MRLYVACGWKSVPCTQVGKDTAVWLGTLQPFEGEFSATSVAISDWLVGTSWLGIGVVIDVVATVTVLGFVKGPL